MQRRISFENKNASDIYQNHKLTLQKEKRRQLTRQRLIWFCLIFFPPKAHSCLLPIQPWNNLSGVSSLTTAVLFSKLLNILNKILEKNVCLFFNLLLMVLETPFILPRNWKSNLSHFHYPSGHQQLLPVCSCRVILSWVEASQPFPKQWQSPGMKSQILLSSYFQVILGKKSSGEDNDLVSTAEL